MFPVEYEEIDLAYLDNKLPPEYDPIDDTRPYQVMFEEIFERICNLGAHVSDLIGQTIENEELFESESPIEEYTLDDIRYLYYRWLDFLVLHFHFLNEPRTYPLPTRTVQDTMASHIFYDLSRMYGLAHYNILCDEKERIDSMREIPNVDIQRGLYSVFSLKLTQQPFWVEMVNVFTVRYDDEEDPDEIIEETRRRVQEMWEKTVMTYTQSDIITALVYLTQQCESLSSAAITEFRRYFELLHLRNSFLFFEGLPDSILTDELMRTPLPNTDPPLFTPNRDYTVLCSVYFGHLLRRFYYYDVLRDNAELVYDEEAGRIRRAAANCKRWVTQMTNRLSIDMFQDLYLKVCDDAYDFGGDAAWFKYACPRRIQSRGNILAELRPHMHKRFFSESNIAKETVLANVNRTHVARTFVLYLIDQQLQIDCNIKWLNAVVINNDGIEMATEALTSNRAPLIVQGFSSYWAYDQGLVYQSDDIFETIVTWFYLLKERYHGNLHGISLHEFCDKVLLEAQAENGDTFEI
jgi:hypothetical protein